MTEVLDPPAAPLEPRDMPTWHGETWRDLAAYVLTLQEAFAAAEADKAAIKSWVATMKQRDGETE